MNSNILRLYDHFDQAFFLERENRFVMKLEYKGEIIKAYIANPGRMEEFLVHRHPFFITTGNTGKYSHRIVATQYQDSYVLLDTIRVNYLVETILRKNLIPEFAGAKTIRREVKIHRSKFDFLLEREGHKPAILEIKSCSLCHNGVAMFPDAPTARGKRHLEDLEQLAGEGYDCFTLYLITNKHANVFIPNGHTDPDYCSTFNKAKNTRFLAYSIGMPDPVTVDIGSANVKPVAIDFEKSRERCLDTGSYLLVFHNTVPFSKHIGALGEVDFPEGYYIYVGSAMNGLDKRIKRHLSRSKKRHWHLDYVSPFEMKALKTFPIRGSESVEEILAKRLMDICDGYVPGFGSSDTTAESHFFRFDSHPVHRREFLNLLLDFRMKT